MVRKSEKKDLMKIEKLPITSLIRHEIKKKEGIVLSASNTGFGLPEFSVQGKVNSFGTFDYERALKKFKVLVKASRRKRIKNE